MEIEELFAAYEPELREKLKDQIFRAIDRSEGSDDQKEQAKGIVDAAFSNLDPGVEEIKWLGDHIEVANRLNERTGILFAVEDFEARKPEVLALLEEVGQRPLRQRPLLRLVK
jgi:hypothetical protein